MQFIMEGKAQSKPQALGLLNEDCLLNPSLANQRLAKFNLVIDRIETVNGEKVVYIKENTDSNLLFG